jgi:N-dimethylarginine dimethylaminohydrolase
MIPSDCPETTRLVEQVGFETIPLDYSEIRKAQAGLTCASIIF